MRLAWLAVFAAVVVWDGARAEAASYWCEPLQAYYPAVTSCPSPWREVEPQYGDPRTAVPSAPDANGAPQTRPATAAQIHQPPSSRPASPTRSDALDEWCKGETTPLLTAICGDDQLRALALQRLHAFDEAKSRLPPDQQKVLIGDQNGWALSYPQACGLRTNVQPTLPLAPSLRDCLAKAGQERLQYLKSYGQQSAQNDAASAAPSSPATPTPPATTAPAGAQPPEAAAPTPPPAPATSQDTKAPPAQASTSAPTSPSAKPAASDPELVPKPRRDPSLAAIADFTRMGAMLIVVVTVGLWIIGVMLRARARRAAHDTSETPQ